MINIVLLDTNGCKDDVNIDLAHPGLQYMCDRKCMYLLLTDGMVACLCSRLCLRFCKVDACHTDHS